VLPPALLEPVLAARLRTDWHPATLAEGVVTDFLAEGHFTQHLRRMRMQYRVARDALAAALAAHLPGRLTAEVPEQGMKLLAGLAPGLSDVALAEAAAQAGVIVRPVSPMYLTAPPRQALMLGFSGHAPAALHRAARALAAACG
jgi:GntR family transcriptional regulator/MocR family aminotransferase